MNIKRQALSGFSNTPDDELLVRATTVLHAMAGNTHFTDPQPALNEVNALWMDYRDKLSIARRRGSPVDTAAKNASRAQLADALHQLAFYVNKIAVGDLQILLSSGFALSSYPRRTDVPDTMRGIVLQDGRQSGQMRLDFERQQQVLFYEYRYGRKPEEATEPVWGEPMLTTSSRNNILAPLAPLQRYYVQVRAVNGIGKSVWSESQSYIVR